MTAELAIYAALTGFLVGFMAMTWYATRPLRRPHLLDEAYRFREGRARYSERDSALDVPAFYRESNADRRARRD